MKLREVSVLCASALVAFTFVAFGAPPAGGPGNPQIQALTSELAALTARVAILEGQITAADLVGTYALHGLQNELSGGVPAQISSYVFGGTVTLNADGTASLNATPENGNTLSLTATPFISAFSGSGSGSGNSTWTYANGTVTLAGGAPPLSVASAGRVLVGASANHSDGTDVILILTRLQ
jgi:hypothetical protein